MTLTDPNSARGIALPAGSASLLAATKASEGAMMKVKDTTISDIDKYLLLRNLQRCAYSLCQLGHVPHRLHTI